MTDDRPLSSEEMIRRARGEQTESSDDLIREARESVTEMPEIEGLENIEVEIPVADEFPEPVPQIQTSRTRRVPRQPVQMPRGPISTDRATRAVVFAVALMIMLIVIGVFVASTQATP